MGLSRSTVAQGCIPPLKRLILAVPVRRLTRPAGKKPRRTFRQVSAHREVVEEEFPFSTFPIPRRRNCARHILYYIPSPQRAVNVLSSAASW